MSARSVACLTAGPGRSVADVGRAHQNRGFLPLCLPRDNRRRHLRLPRHGPMARSGPSSPRSTLAIPLPVWYYPHRLSLEWRQGSRCLELRTASRRLTAHVRDGYRERARRDGRARPGKHSSARAPRSPPHHLVVRPRGFDDRVLPSLGDAQRSRIVMQQANHRDWP